MEYFRRHYLWLSFSEVNGDIHGPMNFRKDERVCFMQQWLHENPFKSRCIDENTNQYVANVEISTTCGTMLNVMCNLSQYRVSDGDTLPVFVRPCVDSDTLRNRRHLRHLAQRAATWHDLKARLTSE